MYKKALVPVSGSHRVERSRQAAAKALEICDGEIVILHVCEPVAQIVGGEQREELTKFEESEALGQIYPIVQLLELSGASFHTRILPGTIADTIISVANEEKCDVIVMFTDGVDSLNGFFFGTITERVLRDCNIDLLAVRG